MTPSATKPSPAIRIGVFGTTLLLFVLGACSAPPPVEPERFGAEDSYSPDGGRPVKEDKTPPGWDKRGGDRVDRIQPGKGPTPGFVPPRGPLILGSLVTELDPAADLDSLLIRVNGRVLSVLPELNLVTLRSRDRIHPDEFLERVKKAEGVRHTAFDRVLEASESRGMTVSFNDGSLRRPDLDHQPFLDRLRVAEAHGFGRGAGVRVAVLDTGVDPTHPDLAGRIVGGRDLVQNDADPWEEASGVDEDGDGLVDESFGHGTHIAGLIALLAPDVELLVYRVLDDEGWGSAFAVSQGIVRAVSDGARVVNLSLGMYEEFRALGSAIDYATRNGVVVVASIGNDATDSPAQYPALLPTVLSVGSADRDDGLAPFSSYGNHLDVIAPGVNVLSLYPGGGFAAWSGSSMATSIASALCALVVQQHPQFTPMMVQRKVIGGVEPGTGLPGITGYGRIDFLRTLQ